MDIEISLNNQDQLRQVLGKNDRNEVEPLYLMTNEDNVAGVVNIKYKGKKFEHFGIKIELIGHIGQRRTSAATATGRPRRACAHDTPFDDIACVLSACQSSCTTTALLSSSPP